MDIDSDPFKALADLRADETTQTVLAAIRRSEPDSDIFSDEKLDAVAEAGEARIYYFNTAIAVQNFLRNTEHLRARHTESVQRANSLIDAITPTLVEELADIDTISQIFSLARSKDEMRQLAAAATEHPSDIDDKIRQELGVPEEMPMIPSGTLKTFDRTWAHIDRDGLYQVGLWTKYTPKLKLYAADMTDSGSFNSKILGIGDYGEEITDRLVLTHAIISQAIRRNKPVFEEWQRQNPDAARNLVRSIDRGKIRVEDRMVVSQMTMHEGSLSIAQALSVLTNDAVDGYSDGDELIRDLVTNRVVSRFAKKLPYSGIIGPLAISGLTYDPLLAQTPSGLGLHPAAEVAFAEARRALRDKVIVNGKTMDHYESGKGHMTYSGCPAAFSIGEDDNGVQLMAELFLDVFERV